MTESEKTKRSLRTWLLYLLVGVVSVGAWISSTYTVPGIRYEFAIHDAMVRLRGQLPSPPEVMVVALDEESYGAWELPMDRPIPREKYAKLITRLAELGAKRVVFDVVFAGPGPNPEWDLELGDAMEKIPVVLGVDHGIQETGGIEREEIFVPHPIVAEYAESQSLVKMRLEDGVARNFLVDRDEGIREYSTLSEAAAGLADPKARAAAVLPRKQDLIQHYGPARWISTVSMYQILENEIPFPRQLVAGKVVFVGLALRTGFGAADLKDQFLTPWGATYGVEIHATQAANLMNQSWIERPEPIFEQIGGGILLLLATMWVLSLSPLWAAFVAIAIACVWAAASYTFLVFGYFLAGAGAVSVVLPFVVAASISYSYIKTRKQQAEIERAFSFYLAPGMVAQLKKDPKKLKLGGEEIVATAMFTDLKGFTTISEQLGAQRITAMLNDYFTVTTKVVMDEGGTIIKFIGDAIFAIWGAPLPQEDHAKRAIQAALKLNEAIELFNALNKYPKLLTRVGVNTGKMVVGNLGSNSRFDYTAIGDAVNLAARVEGVNKYFGTMVLATEDAMQTSGSDWGALKMGAIKVVGKEIPVNLYRLLDKPCSDEIATQWRSGLEQFSERRWSEAATIFRDLPEKAPDLKVACDLYLDSIAHFQAEPPAAEWRGEISMDHK